MQIYLSNMAVVHNLSDVPWPPHSHTLTALFFFFLYGYLQSKVCSSCPVDLKAIRDEIANFSVKTLREVTRSFSTHVHLCFQEGDSHLKENVYKKRNSVKTI